MVLWRSLSVSSLSLFDGEIRNRDSLSLSLSVGENDSDSDPMETSMATLILHYLSHGRTVKYFSNLRKNLGPGVDGWVNRYIPLPTRSKKNEKPKMGTMESFKFLVSSPYIRDLATLVVAYGIISINLVEVTWEIKA